MTDNAGDPSLEALLVELGEGARAFFEGAEKALVGRRATDWDVKDRDFYWRELPDELRADAAQQADRLMRLAGLTAAAIRNAPLATEPDQRDVSTSTKAMRAALLLRRFVSWTPEVLHDEGTVLGVQPAGQSDDEPSHPEDAQRAFDHSAAKLRDVLSLITASRGLGLGVGSAHTGAHYRPNSAFIMMSMDKDMTDVSDAVKDVFRQFDVSAVRADDIQHEDLITTRILGEIETSEFLFADLTASRPNVYYEVGYAHALKRRVFLYRKAGTGLHFDLAGYNCPEYENLRDLRTKLTDRLRHATNRQPKSGTA